ncbi:6-O-methylguanine DNA methyltransferase [Boletus coccyginus]|nr:6-O-methylguanine DNA methyltransferase [Boletus coccyginus]
MSSKYLGTQDFNVAVHQIIRAIPPGRLITCRHIAKLIGFPSQARRVRKAVSFIAHTSPPVAWHRVIPTSGVISVHGPNAQQRLLEAEGIEVSIGVVGESRVDVEKWGWFPEANDVSFDVEITLEDDQDRGA